MRLTWWIGERSRYRSLRAGYGPISPIEVARLELVRLARQRFQVAHAEVARPGGEGVAEGQRRQRRVAARAAAADRQPLWVRQATRRQIARAVDAVVHVHDAPAARQALAIGAPVAGAAAVVHVEHGEAPAGPVLVARVQRVVDGGGRAAMAHDEQRRLLASGRAIPGLCGG